MLNSSDNPVRIESGSYRADVLRGGTKEHFWYYVIGRKDSSEIIHLAKFESYEQAMEAARKTLERMSLETAAS